MPQVTPLTLATEDGMADGSMDTSGSTPHSAERDSTVKKVDSRFSPRGREGEKYLASGKTVSMRLWENEPPAEAKPMSTRSYETVGYVISGRAELHIEGQVLVLNPGDSWAIPRGAQHTYRILEPFTAVEATSPPAQVHGRDD
jgi:quercetin dioxygenase-like cupin family protein